MCFDKLIIGPFEFSKIKVKPDRDNAISFRERVSKLLEFHTHKKGEKLQRHLKTVLHCGNSKAETRRYTMKEKLELHLPAFE
jgi:hypothetical protein